MSKKHKRENVSMTKKWRPALLMPLLAVLSHPTVSVTSQHRLVPLLQAFVHVGYPSFARAGD
ncbi:hypothetical protein SCLCIDRAFT_34131 [Scleroderma citrinum Foug A]|uniref:Uncharacterized protein n=1 Tax=Scleroderma citrinum Foug A TaxID=1036808 RepID=A0A0C3CPY6_9AGAM|nr:hypothetical protein SCLCIDRAFT_34131 [Scleroderma citrinum Foug A]